MTEATVTIQVACAESEYEEHTFDLTAAAVERLLRCALDLENQTRGD